MPFDGAFSPLHWLIVGVVALLVLGPDQLPKLARQAGRAYNEFARVRHHLTSELRDMVSEFDLAASQETPGAAPREMLPRPDVANGTETEEASQ
jgi:TatA/E family protein of Tat protein translocase